MNAIVGMTAIAGAHIEDTQKVRDCLKKINTSSKHLLNLINEVLDMSKIESGRLDVRANDFSLSNLVQNVFEVCRPMIIEKGHHLTMNISKVRHEGLHGDESRLQQVLVNILSNAVKYTPAGGRLHFSIEEKPTHAEGASVFYFTFEDDGIGMSEEFVGRIFEPFSRAEDSRISKIQGTGPWHGDQPEHHPYDERRDHRGQHAGKREPVYGERCAEIPGCRRRGTPCFDRSSRACGG